MLRKPRGDRPQQPRREGCRPDAAAREVPWVWLRPPGRPAPKSASPGLFLPSSLSLTKSQQLLGERTEPLSITKECGFTHRNVGSSQAIDAMHVLTELGTVPFPVFIVIRDKQIGVYHFMQEGLKQETITLVEGAFEIKTHFLTLPGVLTFFGSQAALRC